jgi:hypothetical protein
MRGFPAVRLHLQRPPPSQIRLYPHRVNKNLKILVPSANGRVFKEYMVMKRNIGLVEREILALVYIHFFKALRIEASRHMLIALMVGAKITPPSPQPC